MGHLMNQSHVFIQNGAYFSLEENQENGFIVFVFNLFNLFENLKT